MYDYATLEFRNSDGEVLSEAPSTYGDRTFFGSGLSPDGRFWYGPAHLLILDTTTGARIPTVSFEIKYGWTGPSRLTLIGEPLTVCDAVLGTCTDPVRIPIRLNCAARTEYCGYDVPAY